MKGGITLASMHSDAHAAGCGCPDDSGSQRTPSQNLLFFRNFLRHPNRVGWLLPSSIYVVNSVLRPVNWQTARLLVEYGPGTGTFTRRILERMHPEAKLITFEIDPDFCDFLRKTISDPRFHLFEESAANIKSVLSRFGPGPADAVVSGIPFTMIPHELRIEIVQSTYSELREGGHFLVYQFSGAVRPYLEKSFGPVKGGLEVRNLLPTRIFFCQRDSNGSGK